MPNEPQATEFLRTPGNSFVLPDHKVVYVSVTKVACTGLKWMAADLAGEDLEVFRQGASGVQSRLMKIHKGRERWQHATALQKLSPEQLDEIRTENGWFIFSVVRDPWSRLWSAWQSKFLVRHNRYLHDFGDEPFFPRVPQQAADVVEDFQRFVRMHPWTTDPILKTDNHFMPQIRWVRPEGVPYTKIYDLSRLSEMFDDLHAHLRTVDRDQELYVPRANETPLAMTREVMGDGIRELVEKHYQADFDVFGHRWEFDKLRFAPDGWTKDALNHVAYHTEVNSWIGQIARTGDRYREERNQSRKEARRAERRLHELEKQMQELRTQNRRLRRRVSRRRPLHRRVASSVRQRISRK